LMQMLLWTPETSGGLLAAVDPVEVDSFIRQCPEAVVIGRVVPGAGQLEVVNG
jgi:hypothetical protein